MRGWEYIMGSDLGMVGFLRSYLRSTRPYTFFITGTAGLCGIFAVSGEDDPMRTAVSLVLLFMAYGINQVINDLLGTREDRMNKVKRPTITGELDRKKAWMLTGIIFLVGGVVTVLLNPYALAVYIAGYAFNVIYEQLKGYPLIGNIWFGAMISLAPLYGALSTTNMKYIDIAGQNDLLFLVLLILLVQSNLCYFTYFKDHSGDKKAGKRTLVVAIGVEKARYLNLIFFPIPIMILAVLSFAGAWSDDPGIVSWILFVFSLLVYLYMVIILIKDKTSKRKPLELNFQGAVLFQNGLIAIFYPVMGAILGIASFTLIAVIFHIMYRKEFYG
jgi:geranylgeranylglycerol-phosphate geranylgeranyltransferase